MQNLPAGAGEQIQTVKPAVQIFPLRGTGFDNPCVIAGTTQETLQQQPVSIGTQYGCASVFADDAIIINTCCRLEDLNCAFNTVLNGSIKDE